MTAGRRHGHANLGSRVRETLLAVRKLSANRSLYLASVASSGGAGGSGGGERQIKFGVGSVCFDH